MPFMNTAMPFMNTAKLWEQSFGPKMVIVVEMQVTLKYCDSTICCESK
jgi:hypothetical protein